MKKMKKLLSVLSAITVISTTAIINTSAAYVPSYVAPEDVVSVADTYPYVETLDELKEIITEITPIYYEEYYLLLENLTKEELYEYFESNGVENGDADTYLELYYDGIQQIIEDKTIVLIYPKGQEPQLPEYNAAPAVPINYLTEISGSFESGVTYFYNELTKGLIFDGCGELSEEDFSRALSSFSVEFMFFGNEVTLECHYGARSNIFLSTFVDENMYGCEDRPLIPSYTYADSIYTKQFSDFINEISANKGDYVYYTVEDGTDPYIFASTLGTLPVYISEQGRFGDDNKDVTAPFWHFDGTTEEGLFEIVISQNTAPFEMEDVFEVAKKYPVAMINISLVGTDMTVLPAELQNCETIEEAEAELLRLINEAKAEETMKAVNIGTPTIAGDIDLNDEQGIADIVALTKYNASPELYPITDATALANADVNKDGTIDALDTNILIEMSLGNYESAV